MVAWGGRTGTRLDEEAVPDGRAPLWHQQGDDGSAPGGHSLVVQVLQRQDSGWRKSFGGHECGRSLLTSAGSARGGCGDKLARDGLLKLWRHAGRWINTRAHAALGGGNRGD